jgi:hypothetical protein
MCWQSAMGRLALAMEVNVEDVYKFRLDMNFNANVYKLKLRCEVTEHSPLPKTILGSRVQELGS